MSRDKTKLHPYLQPLADKLVESVAEQGYALLITDCFRTKSEQDALYAKGRTTGTIGRIVTNAKYPDSFHCWGLAFDVCHNVRGDEYNSTVLRIAGNSGKELGLIWGGDWKSFRDTPHFQLNDYGSSISILKNKYGTPDEFIKTWTKKDEPNFEIGDKVIIKSNSKYTNGKSVPVKYTNKPYTISNIKNGNVLIKELFSWVEKQYIELSIYTLQINYYPVYTGSGGLISGLNAVGADSSKENRRKIAEANGITDYAFTASQNMRLLNLLRSGKLIK